MDQFTPHSDLALQLPRDMFYQVIHTLCGTLPPPLTNSPEDRIRRDNAAMARVASLLPANADEAHIAAVYVAAEAQGMECLRLIREYPADVALFVRLNAQSASMLRQAQGARSLLMRVQAKREKREADGTALGKADWTEHSALGLMSDALGRNAPEPTADPAPPPPAPPPEPDAEPLPDLALEAEQFAHTNPGLTALIRSLGDQPEEVSAILALDPAIVPPSPALLHAIVTGTSAALRALDPPPELAVAAE
jgi:hypothetical protein